MHRDVGVCSVGYDELVAVLLLRQQRGHAVQPAPGLWNGRVRRAHSRSPLAPAPPVQGVARPLLGTSAFLRREALQEVVRTESTGRSKCGSPSPRNRPKYLWTRRSKREPNQVPIQCAEHRVKICRRNAGLLVEPKGAPRPRVLPIAQQTPQGRTEVTKLTPVETRLPIVDEVAEVLIDDGGLLERRRLVCIRQIKVSNER